MPAFVTIGRVLFAVLFIVSGASKLFDLAGTADLIASKVVLPAELTTYTSQLEALTGMELKQMLAILAGAVEIVCGVMIALNIGARFFSLLLILFIIYMPKGILGTMQAKWQGLRPAAVTAKTKAKSAAV